MGIGAGLLIYTLINGSATTTVILMSILLMVYGFRLGYFLLARELKMLNTGRRWNQQVQRKNASFC